MCFCNKKSAKIPKEFSTFSKTSIYLLFNHLMVHRRKPKSQINLSSIDQVTEMNNPVDHGCSKLLVSNNLPPFAERKVCRQYQTLVLIAVGNHLEHQFRTHLVQLAIAPFVNDEKVKGPEVSTSLLYPPRLLRLQQPCGKLGESDELYLVSLHAYLLYYIPW